MSGESTLTIERTTISAARWNWSILTHTAPNSTVIIRDSDLHGSGYGFGQGFNFESGRVLIIENCVITDSLYGINLYGGSFGGVSYAQIVGNELYGNIKGIYIASSNVLVENNIIRDTIDGALYTSGYVENVVIRNNTIIPGGWQEFTEMPAANIGPSGGSITINNARLDVPTNALSESIIFTVETVSPSPPSGYSIVGSAYELRPIGTTFALPAIITLPYDEADLQTGWREEDLAIWRKMDSSWENLGGTVDTGANKVFVEITSLSEYAILYARVPGEGVPPAEGIPIVYVVAGVVAIAAAIGLVFMLRKR